MENHDATDASAPRQNLSPPRSSAAPRSRSSSHSRISVVHASANASQDSFPRPIPALNNPNLLAPQGVRLRRLPSAQAVPAIAVNDQPGSTGRRRSASAPQRPRSMPPAPDSRQQGGVEQLPAVTEELSHSNTNQPEPRAKDQTLKPPPSSSRGRARAASSAARSKRQQEYESDIINMLDVVDPQVSTLTTLNNLQNSLFIPYLGRFLNRTPTYNLGRHVDEELDQADAQGRAEMSETVDPELAAAEITEEHKIEQERTQEEREEAEAADEAEEESDVDAEAAAQELERLDNIKSVMTGSHYAVLPHGYSLQGWGEDDKAELNDHVRHLLHSRRAAFKRSMKGFGQFVQKPLGLFVTVYAFLLTFWGAAWVLFLIGWIHAGSRQAYFVEICDQILTALFCMVGLGLAPFRIVDTYHMIWIAKFHYRTWERRKALNIPDLTDPNDLPEAPTNAKGEAEAEAKAEAEAEAKAEAKGNANADVESMGAEKPDEIRVLTEEEEKKLLHHQAKFMKSHTFYRPHETATHHAFSVKLLITVVVLLDCHSMFQAALGGTTWGIKYTHRPRALTAVILTCSICCNISGGITITIGDRRTRKKAVVEQMFRQALTRTAIDQIKKEKGLEPTISDQAKITEARDKDLRKKQKLHLPFKQHEDKAKAKPDDEANDELELQQQNGKTNDSSSESVEKKPSVYT